MPASCQSHRAQSGVALAVSLVLLLVITLIGVTAIRMTTMQQRITANFYDREVGFQSAEAAVMVGAQALQAGTATDRNCGTGGGACKQNPFTDTNFSSSSIHSVATGTGSQQFAAGNNASGQPQYVIEYMGQYQDTTSDYGYNQTANAAQYGSQGSHIMRKYYRITSRSGDPSSIGDRAVVTLQAMYRQ